MRQDRKLIIIALAISIVCLIPFYSSELQEIWMVNHFLISAIPIAVALLLLLIPLIVYHSLKAHENGLGLEVHGKKELAELKKKQEVYAFTKVRSHVDGSEWSVRNTSSMDWDHAVIYMEYSHEDGTKNTEKHHVHHLGSFEEALIRSPQPFVLAERKRVLIVTNKGYTLDIPMQWKAVQDWSLDK